MDTGSGPETVRREGVLASWAPSGRSAVPAIIGLVVVANLVGVVTVVLLLLGVEDAAATPAAPPSCWSPPPTSRWRSPSARSSGSGASGPRTDG